MSGATTSIGCNNTLLRSDSEGLEVVGIELNNIIAVAMTDAVLVANISRARRSESCRCFKGQKRDSSPRLS
jgi:mannose-1-phosphate guanylyltransferase/mannose-6-phosphate isomerase